MTTTPQTTARLLLALSGWAALATGTLGPANPLRVAAITAFLLSCPGTAAMLLAPQWPVRSASPVDRLWSVVLALGLSLAITALTVEAFFLAHAFSPARAMVTLACLTTVLALFPRRHRTGAEPAGPVPGRLHGGAPVRWKTLERRFGYLLVVLLLAFAAACGGAAGGRQAGGGASPSGQAAAGGSVSPAQPTPAAKGPWHTVFRDDFTASTLDRSAWATCYDWADDGCTNPGNNEQEWYLPGQVSLAGGQLSLTAERRAVQGSDGNSHPWVSGMITTGRETPDGPAHQTFTYGYFAAAIQVPERPEGMFPAFWLAPLDSRTNPDELDIAEFINSNRYVDFNLHFGADYSQENHLNHRFGPVDFSAHTHVFAIDWEPDSVTWYVDGVQQFRVSEPSEIPRDAMQVVLDLAVGFEQSPPSDVNSAQLHADWVQVWQH